jgi:hypothetical protein
MSCLVNELVQPVFPDAMTTSLCPGQVEQPNQIVYNSRKRSRPVAVDALTRV